MMASIPIIRVHEVLLVAIQVELSDRLVKELRADLGREIQRGVVRGVVLELSGVDTFDTYIARSIRDMSQMARLMGVKTVVTGLDPGIAITLVEMGVPLDGVSTTLDLESALAMLRRPLDSAENARPHELDEFLSERNAGEEDDDLFELDVFSA
ncbi:MAG: STAS domain-containing protein [Polyangiaceae bacterium]|nr:STAS domain-containing protein [Polyangiaceae bacterium]